MTEQFELGLGYSALNTIRSALSSFIFIENHQAGNHPLVRRCMRGVFNRRPSLPRNNTWDTNIVLLYLRTLSPVRTLKFLTLKAVMLSALLTGQRCQTLHCIDIDCVTLTDSHVKIRVNELIKHTRPGKHQAGLCIKAFAPDRRLCIVTVLKEYLARMIDLRGESKRLFISFVKRHKSVTSATIGRWIREVMRLSGIDIKQFTPHSTRTAAVSNAKVPLSTIMKTAGWTQESTFMKYYN